jgi:hypothetical protein
MSVCARVRLADWLTSARTRGAGANTPVVVRPQGDSSAGQATAWKRRQSDGHFYLELCIHSGQGPVQDQPASAGSFGARGAGVLSKDHVSDLAVTLSSQAEESKQTSEKVFEDRNLTLDAQIVRIMKSKKQMKLQDLINEVIDAVKKLFHPEVKAIKTQVDSLIEREVSRRCSKRVACDVVDAGFASSTLSETKITVMCSRIWRELGNRCLTEVIQICMIRD